MKSNRLLAVFLRKPEAGVFLIGVGLVIIFACLSGNFLTDANVQTVTQFFAPWALIACGEIMLLICGEVDLSVGMVFALSPFIMNFAQQAGCPLILAILIAIAISSLIGFVIGIITVRFNVPSFITTLGAMLLINGITLMVSNGFPIDTPTSLTGNIFGGWGYSSILWAIGIAIIMHFILRNTPWGVHTIAVGGNSHAASEAGINVRKVKIGNFMICSAIGGLAGILNAFHVTSIDPNAGGSYVMFLAIASAVIGGTSLVGGVGTIIGGFIGALVLGILQDGFTLLGVNAFAFDLIIGAAILITMISNVQFSAWRRRSRI